jgi:hypothetical protein
MTFFSSEEERAVRGNPTCLALCIPGVTIKGWYEIAYSYGGAYGSVMGCDILTTGLKSVGSVRLRSSDPTVAPIIDTNDFSVAEDVTHNAGCIQEFRKIMDRFNTISASNVTQYANMHATPFTSIPYYGVADAVSKTEMTPELDDFLRRAMWHHHPTTSNKMGNANDVNSVVDPMGRVWGTSNLYVTDTSVFPVPPDLFPSTNAQAFGFLQAEQLLRMTPPDSRICNPNDFVGVSGPDRLDASDPAAAFRGATIGLSIISGILATVLLITIIAYITRPQGYQVIQHRLSVQRFR